MGSVLVGPDGQGEGRSAAVMTPEEEFLLEDPGTPDDAGHAALHDHDYDHDHDDNHGSARHSSSAEADTGLWGCLPSVLLLGFLRLKSAPDKRR